ncbi:MAG: NlpC/P60 family N-terminal domain-containing protein [Desulfovibrionaceae bacterium]
MKHTCRDLAAVFRLHLRTFFPSAFRCPLLSLVLLAVLTGCAARMQPGEIRDLRELPQDLTAYLDPATARTPLLEPGQQLDRARDYLQALFRPWEQTAPGNSGADFQAYLDRIGKRAVYGENTLPRPATWAADLNRNADFAAYPNLNVRAVAVANSSLRTLPTADAEYNAFGLPGEGFPFDMAQNSAVWAGTPLFAAHLSQDRDWVLVETRYASGWMPVQDLAFVDQQFADTYASGPFLAVVRDRVPLADESGLFRFRARVGALLRADNAEGQEPGNSALVPVRRTDGFAELVRVALPQDSAAGFPLPLTPWNVAAVGNQLLGELYGWGGLFMNRDCSASLMDLFAPFGVALPRNSKAQAQAWNFLSLEGLNRQAKEAALLNQGVPFATLVAKRGHIMLYVGTRNGRAAILHNLWGLRTTSDKGPTPGRIVVGRAVITTLTPGEERNDLDKPKGLLLETVTGISVLPDVR